MFDARQLEMETLLLEGGDVPSWEGHMLGGVIVDARICVLVREKGSPPHWGSPLDNNHPRG